MPDDATRSLPAVPATPWLKALPPALRFILHGGREVREAAAAAWEPGSPRKRAAPWSRMVVRLCGWGPMNTYSLEAARRNRTRWTPR